MSVWGGFHHPFIPGWNHAAALHTADAFKVLLRHLIRIKKPQAHLLGGVYVLERAPLVTHVEGGGTSWHPWDGLLSYSSAPLSSGGGCRSMRAEIVLARLNPSQQEAVLSSQASANASNKKQRVAAATTGGAA